MRIAIVEDTKEASEVLKKNLLVFAKSVKEVFQIDVFESGFDFLEAFNSQYQLVFMDIEMPMMNGLETSKKMRLIDSDVILVFVTNMAQFALQGYEVNGFDFIVKPLIPELFQAKMKRIYHVCHERETDRYVLVKGRNGMRKVLLNDLLYIEVRGHDLSFHLTDQVLSQYGTMKDIEEHLPKEVFSRCNNCYLVNLNHVFGIDGDNAVLSNKEELKMSRNRKMDFIRDYANFLGEHV